MTDYVGIQQPPQKKIRLSGNGTESDFELKMIPSFDTSEANPNLNLFDAPGEFTDTLDNTNLQTSIQLTNPSVNHYQNPSHVSYQQTVRPQISNYQTPSSQRVTAIQNPAMVRQQPNANQQQTIMYHQQQINPQNRSAYSRIPATQQSNLNPNLATNNYNTSGMMPVPGTVGQISLVAANDTNNNHVFINTPQSTVQTQQSGTMIHIPNQHTVTQTSKPLQTSLPPINSQQFNTFPASRAPLPTNPVVNYTNRPQIIDQNSNAPNGYHMAQQPAAGSSVPATHRAPSIPITNNGVNATMNPTNTVASLSQTTESQRKQFIQKQLVLLLHAHKCQQREKQPATNGDSARSNPCTLPHCNAMKEVLQHMTRCNDHRSCPVPHCVTSRQIIIHWKQCTNSQCPICQPLKNPSNSGQPSNIMNNPANGPTPPSTGTNVSKEWQRRVTQDMRNHLVQKIITALVPMSPDSSIIKDKRIANLTNYARRVESETFDIAANQEEYFHKLAEKIYRIQKELEERRERKRQQDIEISSGIGQLMPMNESGSMKRTATMDSMSGVHGPPNRVAPSFDPNQSLVIKSEHTGIAMTHNSRPNGTSVNQSVMGFSLSQVPANDGLTYQSSEDSTAMKNFTGNDMNRNHSDNAALKTEPTSPRASQVSTTVTVKKEDNPSSSAIDASSKQLPKYPVKFSRDELCLQLQPVIDKLIACEDSIPFRQPVDPVALNIHDYPTIIKHPMDISTIQKKLNDGEYETPLKFSEDAWLMFNNAWTYNRKTTRIFKMCTKLSEIFSEAFDPAVQKLGYCCGRSYVYLPQVMFCYGNQLCCQIPRDGSYYYYNNTDLSRPNLSGDKYTFCAKCFDAVKSETIAVGDDPTQPLVELSKNLFQPAKNDTQERETMIECAVCSRSWHQVCALHLEQIWQEGFVCPTCVKQYNIRRRDNPYVASRLTRTELAVRLEQRVNDFLRQEKCQTGRVTIRVLSASDKICEIKARLRKTYPSQVPESIPYRTKAIFAFQEIDGVDVVLFGMHVQEYDGRCPAPNARRVYVSYLDSVHFFRPKQLRTDVYHEILIGYLDYAKQLGYVYAHIWACPPSEGDDYIFHCHPPEQKVPKPKRLQDWYKKMLDRALLEHVILEYKDVMKDCIDNQIQNAWQIPYFEGDFWANIIEESIKELDQEEEERRKQELETARAFEDANFDEPFEAEDPTDISDKRKPATTHKKKHLKKTTSSQRKVAKKQMSNCTDLMSKIFSTMEKHKEAFFVIHLQDLSVAAPIINDNDALIQCDLMDTRDAFLNFARDKHYEFSSLRRAKFSTMALLFELHTSTTDKFTYNCNSCRQQCEVRYHCTECEDFDLCEKCYNMEPKHKHRMERSVPGMVDDCDQNSAQGNGKSLANTQLQRQQSMQRCIEALLHAVNCRNANCVNRSCFRYKRVIQHTKECKGKNSQCNICRQVIFLCWYHAKTCIDPHCQVPFCTNLKSKIQKQRAASSMIDRRRMHAMMQQRLSANIPSQGSSSAISTVFRTDSTQSCSFDSNSASNASGKPSVTLIRSTQPVTWQNPSSAPNQSYVIAQKPSSGKLTNYQTATPVTQSPMIASISRVKSDGIIDDSQRTESQENKSTLFTTLVNKPVTLSSPRLQTTAFSQQAQMQQQQTQQQQQQQQQQWYTANPNQNYQSPPNYSAATRPRFPTVTSQQQQQQTQQNPSVLHTLIAPARAPMPQTTYINRPTLPRPPSTLNIPRASSTQPQDPNHR